MRDKAGIMIFFLVFPVLTNSLFAVDFSGEAIGGFSVILPDDRAPDYIKNTYPFYGDFSINTGLYFPFTYSFSGELSGGFDFRNKIFTLDNAYLQYFGDNFSLLGGKSYLLWGYGWFKHPSYFPDLFLETEDNQMFVETKPLWNISYTHFLNNSDLNFFVIANGLETDSDNWYSFVIRHDLFFEHLAFGWNLALLLVDEAFQFHGALDGEILIDDKWKIDFAFDYKYLSDFIYLLGVSGNWKNFLLVVEISGFNRALCGDVLVQLKIEDIFSMGLLFHADIDQLDGKLTFMVEHEFSGNIIHGAYLNYLFDFEGSIIDFPLMIAYNLTLKI